MRGSEYRAPVPDVALVTARIAEPTDADLAPLLDALGAHDVDATAECWDDPDVDWASFRLAVLRSPWDYVPRYDEFLAWLDHTAAATSVLNPPSVVRWSSDKHYLADLAAFRVPVVPTWFGEPGEKLPNVDDIVGDIVVKPVVSAGSKDTIRHTTVDAAMRHATSLVDAGRSVMLQPYLEAVDTLGETGLVYFDGAFSHAFRKGPILHADAPATDEFFAPEEIAPRIPSDDERRVADAAIAASPPDLLYARVDLVTDTDGMPRVLELELAEPSFFVATAPESAERFATCVSGRLRRMGS